MRQYIQALLWGLLSVFMFTACSLDEPVADEELFPALYRHSLDIPGGSEVHLVNIMYNHNMEYELYISYDATKLKEGEQSVYPKAGEHINKVVRIRAVYMRDGGKLHIKPISAKELGYGSERDIDLEAIFGTYNFSFPPLEAIKYQGDVVLRSVRFGKTILLHKAYDK